MARSEKPIVFEYLFRQRYNELTKTLSSSIVTNVELQEAVTNLKADEGLTLSAGNPANFLKDFLRSSTRNSQWPEYIADHQFAARQSFGGGAVFEFVPYYTGQTEPFPESFDLPNEIPIHVVESVSLPSVARALGQNDESWLTQVIVLQRVLETHFALYSAFETVDLFHLQNNRKGGANTEVDAIFLLVVGNLTNPRKALITFEAKRRDPILGDQIRKQVAYTAKQCSSRAELSDIEMIVPVAAATHNVRYGRGVVAVFEMEPIAIADGVAAYDAGTAHDIPLVIAKAVGYRFAPSISGI